MFVPDPSIPFSILHTSKAGRNWGKWSSKYIDDMADKGLRESDPVKRRAIYHDMQRYLLNKDLGFLGIGKAIFCNDQQCTFLLKAFLNVVQFGQPFVNLSPPRLRRLHFPISR